MVESRADRDRRAEEYRAKYPNAGLPRHGSRYVNRVGREMDDLGGRHPFGEWHLRQDANDRIGNLRLIGLMLNDSLEPLRRFRDRILERRRNRLNQNKTSPTG